VVEAASIRSTETGPRKANKASKAKRLKRAIWRWTHSYVYVFWGTQKCSDLWSL